MWRQAADRYNWGEAVNKPLQEWWVYVWRKQLHCWQTCDNDSNDKRDRQTHVCWVKFGQGWKWIISSRLKPWEHPAFGRVSVCVFPQPILHCTEPISLIFYVHIYNYTKIHFASLGSSVQNMYSYIEHTVTHMTLFRQNTACKESEEIMLLNKCKLSLVSHGSWTAESCVCLTHPSTATSSLCRLCSPLYNIKFHSLWHSLVKWHAASAQRKSIETKWREMTHGQQKKVSIRDNTKMMQHNFNKQYVIFCHWGSLASKQ